MRTDRTLGIGRLDRPRRVSVHPYVVTVTVAFVVLVVTSLAPSPAHASSCKSDKCEAKQDNGNHYGQEKNEDNGNHYGQEKTGTNTSGGGGSQGPHVAASGGVTKSNATVGLANGNGNAKAKGNKHLKAAEAAKERRRNRRQRAADAEQRSATAALTSTALKRFPADPQVLDDIITLAKREPTFAGLEWQPTTPKLDPLSLAASAVDAARALAFPLSLTLAVSAFLLLQGRIDRRDPKLAVWRSDVVHFE